MPRLGVIENWVSRAAWDARDARCVSALPISQVKRVFVHYTGAFVDRQADHANCASRWRAVQAFHLDSDRLAPGGGCDVAYSIGVCRHGFAFEGRGLGKKTAATGPCNFDSYAIVFMGADKVGRSDVGSAGREVIAECVAELERRKKARLLVKGHRDCMSTSCPGDELYSWVHSRAFRRLVNAQKVGGELIPVWQLRAGQEMLRQSKAKQVHGVDGLTRILQWQLDHQAIVRAAEREHGAVSLRHEKVPV